MKESQSTVLVGGAINTDLVVKVGRAPKAGETITGTGFSIFGGGKGANQAVAAARAGARVAMLGGLGNDEFGNARRRDLNNEEIDLRYVETVRGEPSGVALITVETSGENRIAYVPGATSRVSEAMGIDAFASVNPDVLLTTLELPPETLRSVYNAASHRETRIVCNAAPEPESGRELAFFAEVLIVNESEALALLDKRSSQSWIETGKTLRANGPETVIITLGARGAVVVTTDEIFEIEAPEVDVVDTTGAGDAFCGAFAAMLAGGESIEQSARYGVIAGSLATTRSGAQPSIPTRAEIETLQGRV